MTAGHNSRNGSVASSSNDSWASQDTVRGPAPYGVSRGTPVKVKTDRKLQQYEKDPEISPGTSATISTPSPSSVPSSSSLKNHHRVGGLGHHRRDLAVLEKSSGSIPTIHRNPPPMVSPAGPVTSSASSGPPPFSPSVFQGSFYDDSADLPQLSPSFRPGTSRTGTSESPEVSYFEEDKRRPSLASVTTASSQGSKSSIGRGYHKKLQGFFGEEFPGRGSPHTSETSLPTGGNNGTEQSSLHSHHFERDNSVSNISIPDARGVSPHSLSRPRTPLPSSEVTPWVFQDTEDIPLYGDAPIRETPAGPDKQRYAPDNDLDNPPKTSSSAHSHHPHKIHFPGHKHNRSKEDSSKPTLKELNRDGFKEQAPRPRTAREDSTASIKRSKDVPPSAMSSTSKLDPHPPSPGSATSSIKGGTNYDPPQKSPIVGTKRSLFDKLKKTTRHRDDPGPSLRGLPGSTRSLQEGQGKSARTAKVEPGLNNPKRQRDGTMPTVESGATSHLHDPSGFLSRLNEPTIIEHPLHRKEITGKNPLSQAKAKARAVKRGQSYETANNAIDPSVDQSLFNLDTDLSRMEGIVSQPPPTPRDGGTFTGAPIEEPSKVPEEVSSPSNHNSAEWAAPDSWAVKGVADENISRLREIDDAGVPPKDVDDGTPYCVRVFRVDSTFATLSSHLNSTVDELLRQLGKKSFLQDDLENYQIVMRKHDLQRVLDSSERPIAIQKRLFEQTGYSEADRLDEIGREDNSYLCRFTFVPARLSGIYSLEKDPSFGEIRKFSHIDLQGHNLITIPIMLYKRATEIVSLNLSRNLSLDVPKDFIQQCINLREIKYTGNEAWKVPPSLSLASRLTYLDISNNRLEQLDHADLDNLQSLVSIKLANNKISAIPPYFGAFRSLRNLNVSSNSLSQFPDFLCDLTSLVDLDISFNSISALPERIGQFKALERFLATNNRLTGTFPETFASLESLKEIDIRFNGISSIEVINELPLLEQLFASHNSISVFQGALSKMRTLQLNHNPVTRFTLLSIVSTLTTLTISNAKLSQLQDDLFEKMPNLEKLILDKNHFAVLSPQIGKLRKLEYLSLAKNAMNSLPAEVGCLQNLRFLDVRENNLKKLPQEIWHALRLDTLNVSSNILETFPKPSVAAPLVPGETTSTVPNGISPPPLPSSPGYEEVGKLEDFDTRRPSQASGGLLTVGNAASPSQRKGSTVSVFGPGGRKSSVVSRTMPDDAPVPVTRKDSSVFTRNQTTFAGRLRNLYLADNRLTSEVFDEIEMLPELKILNLSYNELYEVPQGPLTCWKNLTELYLSGNELTTLPAEDFLPKKDPATREVFIPLSYLKVLHINGNKFQNLPAELGKVDKLAVLDCGSNALKYNVSNWEIDWNWNYNPNLKYLNLSGNKKLEIKPSYNNNMGRDGKDLTDFTSLHYLRVLGLMDVTLMVPSIPDQTEDRRIRTSGSLAGYMTYGMADSLGRNEHLSQIDMLVPRYGGHEAETLLGMFDGQALSSGGSRVAKFLHENFGYHFSEEMSRLRIGTESPVDALRRTFLALNKDLATAANQSVEANPRQLAHRGSLASAVLSQDDLNSGAVATVMFLQEMELYVANVGDAQAMLMSSDGGQRIITQKHGPAQPRERERIRDAGGFVSRTGRLNDVLDVSRAFGYISMIPAVQAAPHIAHISLKEQDEMILIASRELWDYLTPDVVVDVARSERGDLMRAAQKLRDLAMAFGATGKIMVMILGVGDLKKRERNRYHAQSVSLGPSGMRDDQFLPSKRVKRNKDADDSKLSRLDREVEAPVGDVSLVFTDIVQSTLLWETFPLSMRSAIKMHNEVMRRQLRIIGGYEVKTEGDAFMVSFPTATSALLWCFSVQSALLEVQWPSEVLNNEHGQELYDADGNVIFRGLSVRMGVHWGTPVCEPDPVTRRMDYFGPMVNRAARISAKAGGGQVMVSSDFMGEIQRVLMTYQEGDRAGSTGSDDALTDNILGQAIRRELSMLHSQGFEVKETGEHQLKGLENPEYIWLAYPHSLAGRLIVKQQEEDAKAAAAASSPATFSKDSELSFDPDALWHLWNLSLRLEMLCSALESPESKTIRPPGTLLLEKTKNRGGELTDRVLLNLFEHQIARVETCSSALYTRHLDRPFGSTRNLLDIACPMNEVFARSSARLAQIDSIESKEAKLRAIAQRLGANLDDL
ncbi:MAG: cysteinyl-tRNA synthetase [Sclerophora amabilis]|nr:MAG: cysteinyl-tRNA synthetase [Sclerophora amabilis]